MMVVMIIDVDADIKTQEYFHCRCCGCCSHHRVAFAAVMMSMVGGDLVLVFGITVAVAVPLPSQKYVDNV
eukprot:scaffold76099_cov46-Prasinocladus_malaysianus.AAC.1